MTIRVPSPSHETRDHLLEGEVCNFCPKAALETVHRAIAERTVLSLEAECDACPDFKDWVSRCGDSYFERVHDQWPIIHGPGVDYERHDLKVVATMIILGIWLGPESSQHLRDVALASHKLLVTQLLETLCQSAASSEEAWPLELYHAVLLNAVLAVYCGMEQVLDKARLLCTLMVAHLRKARGFSSEVAAYQEKTYFPGTFLPWVLTTRQRMRRVVVCLFKVDAYLSLLGSTPPNVHREELDIYLPSTFGLWNAFGLDVLYGRIQDEPDDRAEYKLSAMLTGSRFSGPFSLLVEDIELGFCGMLESVWIDSRMRQMALRADRSHRDVVEELATWEKRLLNFMSDLEKLQGFPSDSQTKTADMQWMAKAYRGGMPGRPNEPAAAALNRASMLAQETSLLCHLLALHVHCDPSIVSLALAKSTARRTGGDSISASLIQTSSSSKINPMYPEGGNQAVAHSLAILYMVEAACRSPLPQTMLMCPVTAMAATLANNILQQWFADRVCSQEPGEQSHETLDRHAAGLPTWADVGYALVVDDGLLCECCLRGRMSVIEQAIMACRR
jgi:hypothetical protein